MCTGGVDVQLPNTGPSHGSRPDDRVAGGERHVFTACKPILRPSLGGKHHPHAERWQNVVLSKRFVGGGVT